MSPQSLKKQNRNTAGHAAARHGGTRPRSETSVLVFGMPVQYWQLGVAVLALIAAVTIPWLVISYNKSQSTANISYQIIVQPDIVLGPDGKTRNDTWLASIMTINNGPATAQSFVMHLKLSPNLRDYVTTGPSIANRPPGTDFDIAYAGGGSTYLISVKNLAPQTTFIVAAHFVVSSGIKDDVQQQWASTEMFSPKFIGRFVRYLWTSGENIKPSVEGMLSPTPVVEWYAPDE